jgi:hypothetical protein
MIRIKEVATTTRLTPDEINNVFKIKCLFLQPDYGTDKNII